MIPTASQELSLIEFCTGDELSAISVMWVSESEAYVSLTKDHLDPSFMWIRC